jgi:hypothetical protein
MENMQLTAAIERLERVISVRSDVDAVADSVTAALASTRELVAFLAAAEADLVGRVARTTSFPEAVISDVTRESLGASSKVIERSRTLESAPALAAALDDATVTPGHVDVVTRGAKGLEPPQRQQLLEVADGLVGLAESTTVEQFGRRIRTEANRITRDDGIARLERQRRATSMSTWTDDDGMWNVRGRFDPVTALSVSSALDRAVETLFAEAVPDTCPSDPVEKQKHLRALAFARLVQETAVGGARAGRPEFVGVIDITGQPRRSTGAGTGREDAGHRGLANTAGGIRHRDASSFGETSSGETGSGDCDACGRSSGEADGSGGAPHVTWPIPIEVPVQALAEMIADADIHTVVVRNGVVLHAPGNLDLGRTTRLANRAQRRALRGLYSTCAVPGCSTAYDRCKLHHVTWWRNGGRTDLHNLLPLCVHHHHKVHDAQWDLTLGPNHELTIRFPDGTVRNTGPPRRDVA